MRAIVLVGLPGSGKTTFVKQKYLPVVPNYIYVNIYDIQQCLFGRVKPENITQDARRIAYTQAEGALRSGHTLIYVAPNVTKTERQHLLSHLRAIMHDMGEEGYIEGAYIKTPIKTCLLRHSMAGLPVSEADMDDMNTALLADPPREDDGFNLLVTYPGPDL